jgi:putative redox protein
MATNSRRQPIVVTHEGGVRFVAQVRSHRVVVDQPVAGGGEDAGPMPLELIGASLGTCIALYVQQFLHARGMSCEGMRVEVDQSTARNPSRVSDYDVHVVLPSPIPPEYAELLDRVARSCPAHNTLQQSPRIAVSIEAPSVALA